MADVEPEVVSVASAFSIQWDSPLVLGSLVVAIIGVILLIFLQSRGSSQRGRTVLLVGPSDAGKTAIFTKATHGYAPPTHTSMQPNDGLIPIGESRALLKLVDVPGHPRIRATFSEHMLDARGIVFVVDASTIARNGTSVAEHLHTILSSIASLPPTKSTPPLLVFAHKADLLVPKANPDSISAQTLSLARDRVKTILERELEKRRKGAGVGLVEDEDVALGGLECSSKDGSFKFDDWEGGEVSFASGWVDIVRDDGIVERKASKESADDGLKEFWEWIDTLA